MLLNYDCERTKSVVAQYKFLIPVFPARVNCKQFVLIKYLLYAQLSFKFFLITSNDTKTSINTFLKTPGLNGYHNSSFRIVRKGRYEKFSFKAFLCCSTSSPDREVTAAIFPTFSLDALIHATSGQGSARPLSAALEKSPSRLFGFKIIYLYYFKG